MDVDQLNEFLTDPGAYIGENAIRIRPATQSLVGADVSTMKVPHVGEFECTLLSAPRNTHTFHLTMGTDARTLEVGPSSTGRQSQTRSAFYLPWASNKIFAMRLDNLKDTNLFFTAEVNGCCVFIAGQDTSPYVVHANLSTDDLEEIDLKGVLPIQMGAVLRKHQLKIYDRNYWALLGRLQGQNIIPDDVKVTMFDPSTYFARDGNKARIFGVKTDGHWKFYTNTETSQRTGMPPRMVHVSEQLAC